MVLCCFGVGKPTRNGASSKERPPTTGATALEPKHPERAVVTDAKSAKQISSKVAEQVSPLRCQLATVQGAWHARLHASVDAVHSSCMPVSHVSLFGASPCGSALVLLASAGAGVGGAGGSGSLQLSSSSAAALAPGVVLPAPWLPAASGSDATLGATPTSSAAVGNAAAAMAAMAACSGSDEGLMLLGTAGTAATAQAKAGRHGRAAENGVLRWQFPEPQGGLSDHTSRQSSGQPNIPQDWRALLASILGEAELAAATAAEAAGAHGTVAPSPAQPRPPASLLVALVPLRLAGSLAGALMLVATAHQVSTQPPWSEELLSGVAAAVAECCVGPHLTDIHRLAAAAQQVAAAADLQGLASALSSAVVDSLSSELYVEFSARLAVVPQACGAAPADVRSTAPYGFLLTEQVAVQQGQVGVSDGPQHRLSQQGHSRGNGRSSLQHAPVERLLAMGGVVKMGGSSGLSAGGSPAWGDATGGAANINPSGVLQHAGLSSGVHSFNLPGGFRGQAPLADSPARVWKARAFCMESTLLSSLTAGSRKIANLPSATVRGAGAAPASYDDTSPAGAATQPGSLQVLQTRGSLLRGGTGGGGPFRVRAAAVPHVQAYVNDTDQPSADVMLLFRPGGAAAAAGAGGRASAPHGAAIGGAAAAATGPASLVAVAGCVTICVDDGAVCGLLTGGGGGEVGVCVALYLTSVERLPATLLSAARGRAQALFELLLPAAAVCLSEYAYAELQYMYDTVAGTFAGSVLPSASCRTMSTPSARQRMPAPWSPAQQAAGAPVGVAAGAEVDGEQLTIDLIPAAPTSAADDNTAAAATAVAWGPGALLASQATRYASDASTRVPRSRLSQTTAAVTNSGANFFTAGANFLATGGGGIGGGGGAPASSTLGFNQLLLSTNNLMAALMGNDSNAGGCVSARSYEAALGPNAALPALQHCASGLSVTLSGACATAASALSSAANVTQPGGGRSTAPRRALGLQQLQAAGPAQAQAAPQVPALQAHPGTGMGPPSIASALGAGRGSGRGHTLPRRQASELLATMPNDVSDALSVMRTNMDVLVSSFWSTLRSQAADSSPNAHADDDLRFLRLTKVLGGGGCSRVYAGLLHGLEVAVKVMKATADEEEADEAAQEEQAAAAAGAGAAGEGEGEGGLQSAPARQAQLRALMRGARELAVMTSISHPNIVQIYSYHTRVLVRQDSSIEEEAGAGRGDGGDAAADHPLPRLVPVPPGVDVSAAPGPLQTVLVMECCDLGSLADALDSGMFAAAIRNAEAAKWRHAPPRRSHTLSQLPAIPARGGGGGASGRGGGGGGGATAGGGSGGGMRAILMTLLEVALALRHMHAMQLVHCDVKPANVLLRSSASDPRGFTCKLTDFGFVNLLQYQSEDADDPQAKPSMRYHEPVGTVTHLAPETMVQGSKLDHTVDVYAFGILMWEVYTGKAPYAEYAANNFQEVPYLVVRDGMRPVFPSSTPPAFKTLAQACWSSDVARRPTAAVLVASLQRLMDAAARG